MIIFIIPKYFEGVGNAVLIRDELGERPLYISLNSAIKKAFEERGADFRVLKKKTSRFLNQKNLIPLLLSNEEVLIPIKVRKPLLLRDGGYGYVNFAFIKNIEANKLYFSDGSFLEFQDNKRAVTKRIQMAKRLIDKFYENDYFKLIKNMDMSLPATKGDIFILFKEIMSFNSILKDII